MTLASRLVHRILVTILAFVAVAAQITLMRAGSGDLSTFRPSVLPVMGMGAVDSLVAVVLALALVYVGDPERGAHALGVCLVAWGYVLAYSGVIDLLDPARGATARMVIDAHFPFVEALGLAGALRFSCMFPRPVTAADIADPASVPFGLRMLQRVRRSLLRPAGPWIAGLLAFVALLVVNRLTGGVLQEAPLNPLAAVVRFAAFTAVVLNLRVSWIRARGQERIRLLWTVVGLVILFGFLGFLIGGNVLLAVTGWRIPLINWRPVVLDLGLLGLLWGMVMGVFYGGSADPSALGRRAAVLAGWGTFALFLAAGLEALFSDVLIARTSIPAGLGTVIALVIAAIAYLRTRRALESSLDQAWSGVQPASAD